MAPVTVVVPVYNAFEATRRCLAALARHTAPHQSVMLLDDASTDPRVPGLLHDFATGRPGVRVVTHERNLGFVAGVNRALESAAGDVVVLNSDTEVGPGWLEAL